MSSLSLFKALSFPRDKPHVQIYYVGVLLCLHLQSSNQLSHINGCKGQSDLAVKRQTSAAAGQPASQYYLSFASFVWIKGSPFIQTKDFWYQQMVAVVWTFYRFLKQNSPHGACCSLARLSCDIVSALSFSVLSQVGRCSVPPSFTLILHSCFLICLDSRVTSSVWIFTHFSLKQ